MKNVEEQLQMKFSPGPSEQLSKEQQEKPKKTILDFVLHDAGFTAQFNWTLQIIGEYIHRGYLSKLPS